MTYREKARWDAVQYHNHGASIFEVLRFYEAALAKAEHRVSCWMVTRDWINPCGTPFITLDEGVAFVYGMDDDSKVTPGYFIPTPPPCREGD